MLKKVLATLIFSSALAVSTAVSAEHIHAFPSIDKPDKDIILIKDYFSEDLANDTKYIFTNGMIGYRLFFAGPGAWSNTDVSPYIYFYVPAQDGKNSKIMRMENKSGPFNRTRAFKLTEYTPQDDKQVPAFVEVLDKCFNETVRKLGK